MQRFVATHLHRSKTRRNGESTSILLLEDNAATAERRHQPGVGRAKSGKTITIRVHRFAGPKKTIAARTTYHAGTLHKKRAARIDLAIELLERAANGSRVVVVAGTSYGDADQFLADLAERGLPFVVQIRPSKEVALQRGQNRVRAADLLNRDAWRRLAPIMPDGREMPCIAATLGEISVSGEQATLFAAQIGSIKGVHRGTILGIASHQAELPELVRLAAHARWIRSYARSRRRRTQRTLSGAEPTGKSSALTARANIAIARRQDTQSAAAMSVTTTAESQPRLGKAARILNVVELFSGAGGMGLGFLLGGGDRARYRIVYSGEVNPIFAQTLRANHRELARLGNGRLASRVPAHVEPVDLRERRQLENAAASAKEFGGAHVLIGGPPCQGFSIANRNSWSGGNPNNHLVHVFLRYVEKLRPLAFLLENVQGILWTPKLRSKVSVVDVIEQRMQRAGYILFPKLLDAVWYGVPQHRTRFFLLGLHRDLAYDLDSFDEWGPFPRRPFHGGVDAYTTVRQAIADLPRIGNGHEAVELAYAEPAASKLAESAFLRFVRTGAPEGFISDHVTSRHADYVIDRYRRIPAGGNWEDIRDSFTNYADVSRTHSNIYRRLRWDEPSITIGHYRKSMLVHPTQHRGLSLREAARLQSFPDWFRFAGSADGRSGGLVHKQQQLANAVCPLVTKAIAEALLAL
jgi:DNA-cytosine methyltransferase